jgi:hypothetical protein
MGWPLAFLQPVIQMNVNNSRDHGAGLQVLVGVSRGCRMYRCRPTRRRMRVAHHRAHRAAHAPVDGSLAA